MGSGSHHRHHHREFDGHSIATSTVDPVSSFASPPSASTSAAMVVEIGYELDDDGNNDLARNSSLFMNNESMMSAGSDMDEDDDNTNDSTASEDESDDAAMDTVGSARRELTDDEIFDGKSSYEDYKFLTKSLQRWSRSRDRRGASMGLNNGCLIAVPPEWTCERRANFARWVATAFGFRIGSVGGSGGSFLRCSDAEGKGVLARLVRISNDRKANRMISSTGEAKNLASACGRTIESQAAKPKPK